MDGNFEWEQLFKWEAAKRELGKNWLKMLEKEDWRKIMKSVWWKTSGEQSTNIIKKLGVKRSIYLGHFYLYK